MYTHIYPNQNYRPIQNTNLKKLSFSEVYAENAASLKTLTKLHTLDFGYNCEVDSLDFLEGTTDLYKLAINKVRHFVDFKQLGKLSSYILQ